MHGDADAAPRFEPLGETQLIVRFADRIAVEVNRRAHAAAAIVQAAALPGVRECAAAYASVAIRYDPDAWLRDDAIAPWRHLVDALRTLLEHAPTDVVGTGEPRVIEIPVRYGGADGPDLEALAAHLGLAPADVVARHCAVTYDVAMLGFAPGFAYLIGLDPSLRMPRRAQPRTSVPAGSVAIGGLQTGIYPSELPGGWHLLGRTPLTLFDLERTPVALLAAGDRVRFRAIAAPDDGASAWA